MSGPIEISNLCAVRVLVMGGWTQAAIARGFCVHQNTIMAWIKKSRARIGYFRRMEPIRSDLLPEDLGPLFARYGQTPDLLPKRWPWSTPPALKAVNVVVPSLAPGAPVDDPSSSVSELLRAIHADTQALLAREGGEPASVGGNIDPAGVLALRWITQQCCDILGPEGVADELNVSLGIVRSFVASSSASFPRYIEAKAVEIKRLYAAAVFADEGMDEDDIDDARSHIRRRQKALTGGFTGNQRADA